MDGKGAKDCLKSVKAHRVRGRTVYLLRVGVLVPSVERSLAWHAANPNVVRPREVFLVVKDDEVTFIFVDGIDLVLWKPKISRRTTR